MRRFREYTSNRHNISVALDPHGMVLVSNTELLAAGAGHYFSLTAYKLTFKPPYRGKGLKNDIS